MAEAGFPNGEGLLPLRGTSGFNAPFTAEIARQWHEALGLTIAFETIPSMILLPEQLPHIHIGGWIADYPDPDVFLRQLPAREFLRRASWRDTRFDELVEQAARTPNRARRMAMYREADHLWVAEQALVIPLYYATQIISIAKPRMQGYARSALGDHAGATLSWRMADSR
jgi:ABC-type oligopeptide transport system substrate-binding subunit